MDRVADGKIMIPGLSFAADNIFFCFFPAFVPKSFSFYFEKSLHKLQIR